MVIARVRVDQQKMNYDVAIMQPTYLPWAGYFNLISSVRTFVFLDDVQFSKSSWQSRNRIIMNGEVSWLSVPISHSRGQLINEVRVRREAAWPEKHVKSLEQAYSRAPYFTDISCIIESLRGSRATILADVNVALIELISQRLGFECRFLRSSGYPRCQGRSESLLQLIKEQSARSYLSPEGAREYLQADGLLPCEEVEVYFQNYEPTVYPQRGSPGWISHLSILDVVANIGWESAKEYVRGARRSV